MEKIVDNAIIKEVYKNKALVECDNFKQVVTLKSNKQVGESVSLYKTHKFNLFVRVLFYIAPLILTLLGFGLGFLFANQLYHYILMASLGLLGFLVVLFVKLFYIKPNFNNVMIIGE